MAALVTCSHCSTVCNVLDGDCHACGKPLRGRDGTIGLTAAAALLGLTMTGCGGDNRPIPEPAPAYGGPPEVEVEPTVSPAEPVAPSAAPSTTTTPSAERTMAPAYGAPPVAPPQAPQK